MSYSNDHDPAYATIDWSFGFHVTFHFPEKELPGSKGRHLTVGCGHTHRQKHKARECANKRTDDVRFDA